MTKRLKEEDPDSLFKKMRTINISLLKPNNENDDQYTANEFAFNASAVTFCCVQDSNNSNVLNKAYGASMTCKGKTQRIIMIAISALHVWDRAVSYAVCCAGSGPPITFPKRVQCATYSFTKEKLIPSCNKCFKMYDLTFIPKHEAHNKEEFWPYGNCAENESLSRLLDSDENVRKEVCIIGDKGQTLMNRQDIENKFKEDYEGEAKKRVRDLLACHKFKLPEGEWNFFTPSV